MNLWKIIWYNTGDTRVETHPNDMTKINFSIAALFDLQLRDLITVNLSPKLI